MLNKRRLYAYMHAIIENNRCSTLRINGMSDHVHILINLHPTVALATLVQELKQSTSRWLKGLEEFKGFKGWNDGYYASSIGCDSEDTCINYIKNQEIHHATRDVIQEVKEMAMVYNLEWDERDWI